MSMFVAVSLAAMVAVATGAPSTIVPFAPSSSVPSAPSSYSPSSPSYQPSTPSYYPSAPSSYAPFAPSSSSPSSGPYVPQGVQFAVPTSTVGGWGWTLCASTRFDSKELGLNDLLSRPCMREATHVMLASRFVGDSTLTMLAAAPKGVVIEDPSRAACPTTYPSWGGVSFYFATSCSWGFFKQNTGVTLNSCDVAATEAAQRMCWHTASSFFSGGYRVGTNTSLNTDATREKLVFTLVDRNPPSPAPISTVPTVVAPTSAPLIPLGVQFNISVSTVEGWGFRQCGDAILFSNSTLPLSTIFKSECFQAASYVMLASRETDSRTLMMLAAAPKAVVAPENATASCPTRYPSFGSVSWYLGTSCSWGFFHLNDSVQLNTCDTFTGSYPQHRMCWHTKDAHMSGGYRIGNLRDLNGDAKHEKVIYTLHNSGETTAAPVMAPSTTAPSTVTPTLAPVHAPTQQPLVPLGVQFNVPLDTIESWGFDLCAKTRYSDSREVSLATLMQQKCMQEANYVLLAARRVGTNSVAMLAAGPKDVVIPNQDAGCVREPYPTFGGVSFYYSTSCSWGFFVAGDTASLNTCDIGVGKYPNSRMCWHTAAGYMTPGYRVGNLTGVNDASWEKLIYTLHDPTGVARHFKSLA